MNGPALGSTAVSDFARVLPRQVCSEWKETICTLYSTDQKTVGLNTFQIVLSILFYQGSQGSLLGGSPFLSHCHLQGQAAQDGKTSPQVMNLNPRLSCTLSAKLHSLVFHFSICRPGKTFKVLVELRPAADSLQTPTYTQRVPFGQSPPLPPRICAHTTPEQN